MASYFIIFAALYQSWIASLAFLVAMYGHELGHLALFRKNKIKSVILLLFPIGAAALPITPEENERSDMLPWWDVSWILIAGPIMNAVQMIISGIMIKLGVWPEFFLQLIFINGLLGLFNLLPLGNFDGGQFFHVIFSSLEEKYDSLIALMGIVAAVAICSLVFVSPIGQGSLFVLIALYKNFGVVSFAVLAAIGLAHKQGRDNPQYCGSDQAMSPKQALIMITIYLALVITTLYLLNSFPVI